MAIYTASKEKGRFISEDPIKGSMLSSQSQNPYVYCMNNPLRFIDPSGMNELLPDDPYLTYGHLNAAELVYGIREDPSIFDDIIDDYNTWYDYWHGDGSSGHDYPDQNLYKEAEREVDGLRRFSGSFSAIVPNLTLEYLHDLHKDSINERAFRVTLGSSVSAPAGAVVTVGTVYEESVDNYLNNNGWASIGGQGGPTGFGPGINLFFNSENEFCGQEAVFGLNGAGVNINTADDLIIYQYYNGQASGLLIDVYSLMKNIRGDLNN